MGTDDWGEYNDAQVGREPRELCLRAIELAGPGEGRVGLQARLMPVGSLNRPLGFGSVRLPK